MGEINKDYESVQAAWNSLISTKTNATATIAHAVILAWRCMFCRFLGVSSRHSKSPTISKNKNISMVRIIMASKWIYNKRLFYLVY